MTIDNCGEEVLRIIIFNLHITDHRRATMKSIYDRIKVDDTIGFSGKLTSFRTLLLKMGFRWKKTTDNRKILIRKSDKGELRCNYIHVNKLSERRSTNNIYNVIEILAALNII